MLILKNARFSVSHSSTTKDVSSPPKPSSLLYLSVLSVENECPIYCWTDCLSRKDHNWRFSVLIDYSNCRAIGYDNCICIIKNVVFHSHPFNENYIQETNHFYLLEYHERHLCSLSYKTLKFMHVMFIYLSSRVWVQPELKALPRACQSICREYNSNNNEL